MWILRSKTKAQAESGRAKGESSDPSELGPEIRKGIEGAAG